MNVSEGFCKLWFKQGTFPPSEEHKFSRTLYQDGMGWKEEREKRWGGARAVALNLSPFGRFGHKLPGSLAIACATKHFREQISKTFEGATISAHGKGWGLTTIALAP